VAVERGDNPIADRLFTAKIFVDPLSLDQRASVVPQTHKHGDLHRLDSAIVDQWQFWVLFVEVVWVLLAKTLRLASLAVESHSLGWNVLQMHESAEARCQIGRALSHDQVGVVLPVKTICGTSSIDAVLIQPFEVLFGVAFKVGPVRRRTRSKHHSGADVLVIPLRDETHTSESLCGALRVTDKRNFLSSVPLLYHADNSRGIFYAIVALILAPEFFGVVRQKVIRFAVGCKTVAWQVDVIAHGAHLEGHRDAFVPGIGAHEFACVTSHAMLKDHCVLGYVPESVFVAS